MNRRQPERRQGGRHRETQAERSGERRELPVLGAGPELYPIPREAAAAWVQHRTTREPLNAGLVFDRFCPNWGAWEQGAVDGRTVRTREWGLREVARAAELPDRELFAAWSRRWELAAEAAGAAPFTLRAEWRLVTGLGAHGPLEVGFTFQRYGFPVLPASGVKGVARAAGLQEVAQGLGTVATARLEGVLSADSEEAFVQALAALCPGAGSQEREAARAFRLIFGAVGAAGAAVFLDGIPAEPPALELDIMNPHYPEYYGDKGAGAPPAGWQSPVPVHFLTIAPGSAFRFAVGWRGERDGRAAALRAQAQRWLVAGLTELGAGAKTSAGYGYFAPPASVVSRTAEATGSAEEGGAGAGTAPGSGAPPPGEESAPAERVAAAGAPGTDPAEPLVQELLALRVNEIAPRIHGLYQQSLRLDESARRRVAAAIHQRLEEARLLRRWADRPWVQALLGDLGRAGEGAPPPGA